MENIKIAIQKKGRLSAPSKQLLASLGLRFSNNQKKLAISCTNAPVSLINVRDNDIPKYVSESAVDFGIVGLDVVREGRKQVKIKKKLNFCKCKMVIAVPSDSPIKSTKDLAGKRIATSYPNILNDFLNKRGIKSKIVIVEGSVELAPYLQAADAVCDITETGKTLREFNLIPIKTILKSQAVLISPLRRTGKQDKFINQFLTHLRRPRPPGRGNIKRVIRRSFSEGGCNASVDSAASDTWERLRRPVRSPSPPAGELH